MLQLDVIRCSLLIVLNSYELLLYNSFSIVSFSLFHFNILKGKASIRKNYTIFFNAILENWNIISIWSSENETFGSGGTCLIGSQPVFYYLLPALFLLKIKKVLFFYLFVVVALLFHYFFSCFCFAVWLFDLKVWLTY